MTDTAPATVVAALTAVTSGDAAQPLITYYDDATGERTELSGATLANWVAKTANLLVDDLGLGPGDIAAVALPPHWLTAGVLLGCWSAGLAVRLNAATSGTAGPVVGPAVGTPPAAVGFGAGDRLDQLAAGDRYALALDPFARGFPAGPPAGTLDFSVEVRGHGDHFSARTRVGPDTVALATGETHDDLVAAALAHPVAADRVLIDAALRPDPVQWLVVPLLRGASIVLCRHLDQSMLDRRLAAERAVRW